jgi:hypothetical protein
MFAVLPIVGGILLGWLASRRTAVLVQILFVALASFAVITTAPDHGHTRTSVWWLAPVIALLGALSLAVGFWIAARRAGKAVPTT